MLLVVHNGVGPVVMLLLHVPTDEHFLVASFSLCTAIQVVHAKASNESV